jgi:RNA polymerase primary sigma factor
MAKQEQIDRPYTRARKNAREALDIYLDDIKRYPLIDREEEAELARRAQAGDDAAMDKLVRSNLRFVVSIAKKYTGQGVPLDDLINEGNLGLVRAAHRFDPERGYKFISYAVWWVRQAILQNLSQHSRVVRLPLNKAGNLSRIGKASQTLWQELGREPTHAEIAESLGLDARDVEDTVNVANGQVSLHEAFSDEPGDHAYIDYLEDTEGPAPDDGLYREFLSHDVQRALATLNERERTIMTLYFGLAGETALTLEEIGRHLNLTRERIRQIKEQAVDKLRQSSRTRYLSAYMDN